MSRATTHRPPNAKQLKFVELFLATNNPTQSYIDAGYKGRGKTATNGAAEILAHPGVAALIQESRQKAITRIGVTAAQVIAELAKLAFLDPRKAFHADGTLRDIHELDDATAACVSSIEVEERIVPDSDTIVRTRKIRFWDKKGALVDLGQHFDLWSKKAPAPEANVNLNVQLKLPPPAAVVGYLKDLGYGDADLPSELPRLEGGTDSGADPGAASLGDVPSADAVHGDGSQQSMDSHL